MRTISIIFALAVVGGTAPAAPHGGLGHVSLALLVFTAALAVLLSTCLVRGWLLSELRTLMRQPSGHPAGRAPSPAARLAHSSSADRRGRVSRAPQASASRPSYTVPIER
jgi:hypothetical protein